MTNFDYGLRGFRFGFGSFSFTAFLGLTAGTYRLRTRTRALLSRYTCVDVSSPLCAVRADARENGKCVRRCRGHTRQATRDLARSAGCRLAYLTKAGEAGLSNQALCAMRILYWVINININIFAPHYVVLAVA